MEHELVPKHEVLTKKEREEVLEKFSATIKSIPKILISDPVIERIEAKEGDLIRITRKSPTAGESIYYRAVFDPSKKKVKEAPAVDIVETSEEEPEAEPEEETDSEEESSEED